MNKPVYKDDIDFSPSKMCRLFVRKSLVFLGISPYQADSPRQRGEYEKAWPMCVSVMYGCLLVIMRGE